MSDLSDNNASSLLSDTNVVSIDNKSKRKSFMEIITEKKNNQDFNQRINVGLSVILELYRVLMGALLLFVVPQQCNNTVCTTNEIITRTDPISITAFTFNILTLFSFITLYFVEVKRENKMITYLEVNKSTAFDNESVGNALEKLSSSKKESIWTYDKYYQKAGYVSTGFYSLNAIFSSIVAYLNYLDSSTLTVLITNLLFMGLKVADVFGIVNTDKNIFYSAYLKDKVQFNDVDPDKLYNKYEVSNQVEELPDTSRSDSVIDEPVDTTESV